MREPPAPGETRAARRRGRRISTGCCPPARPRTGSSSASIRSRATRTRFAGGPRAQIDEGRSWLWLEDGVIRFKAEASAWTPSAVQIQQVWVDPQARGRGDGARGLRDLCRLLLETTPRVCLFVRRENAPAIALYERSACAACSTTGAFCSSGE